MPSEPTRARHHFAFAIISRKFLPMSRLSGGWARLLSWKLAASLSVPAIVFVAGSLLHPAALLTLTAALLILIVSVCAAALYTKPIPQRSGSALFFEGFDKVTRSAGVRIWEWDVVHNTMQFSGDRAEMYGTEIKAAKADADDVMLGKVHPEDRPRYRKEFIKALKGVPVSA